MKSRIQITGMGIQSSIGHSIPQFMTALREGRTGIRQLTEMEYIPSDVRVAAKLGQFCFQDQLAHYSNLSSSLLALAKQIGNRASLPIQTSILAALEAWSDARLDQSAVSAHRMGIVVSCDQASQRSHYDTFVKFLDSPDYISPRYALHALPSDHVGVISELLTIKGEGFAVSGASASGNVAIIKAAQLIELDLVDVCFVVGALSELSPLALQGYRNIGAMGAKKYADFPLQACRPFDAEHEGFIYGEASGCLVLESEASLHRRQAHSHAIYLGGKISLDSNRMADPSEEGEAEVIKCCLDKAGVLPLDIHYINAHGSSSPLGDHTEMKVLKHIFGDALNSIWVNSTKSLTGHCLFSAGIVEAIATILQLQYGFIHPNKNLIHPIEKNCRFAPDQSVTAAHSFAMSNSFGFGGINSTILLQKKSS